MRDQQGGGGMTGENTLLLIRAGGALHLGWAVFHLFFPRLFKWEKSLAVVDAINRRLMPVLNLCLTFYFLAAGYLSFAFAQDLALTPLGRKLLGVFSAFWLFRLSLQFKFFKALHPASLVLIPLFGATMACYAIPLIFKG